VNAVTVELISYTLLLIAVYKPADKHQWVKALMYRLCKALVFVQALFSQAVFTHSAYVGV